MALRSTSAFRRQPALRAPGTRGFTLVELIVVIIIVGILAAVALPKFLDLQGQARYATLQSLVGAMESADSMVYAKALVAGQTGPTGSVVVEGVTITLVYGYPDSTATGIITAMNGMPGYSLGQNDHKGGLVYEWNASYAEMGYSPLESGQVNICVITFNPATATDPPQVSIYGDQHPDPALGGSGPAICRSGSGTGPGAF